MESLLRQLDYHTDRIPRSALREIINRREEATPYLLGILSDAKQDYLFLEPDYMGHFYAVYLLAQFREKKAFPLIIDLLSLPGGYPDDLFGDALIEDVPVILAATYDGNFDSLATLIENEEAYVYSRDAALGSLTALVRNNLMERGKLVAYLRELFHGRLSESDDEQMWNSLTIACCDLQAPELRDEVLRAYDRKLMDESFLDLPYVECRLAGKESKLLGRYDLIEDIVERLKTWACFQPKEKPNPAEHRKVGRNDPCPCGSGNKFKKCCLGKDGSNVLPFIPPV